MERVQFARLIACLNLSTKSKFEDPKKEDRLLFVLLRSFPLRASSLYLELPRESPFRSLPFRSPPLRSSPYLPLLLLLLLDLLFVYAISKNSLYDILPSRFVSIALINSSISLSLACTFKSRKARRNSDRVM